MSRAVLTVVVDNEAASPDLATAHASALALQVGSELVLVDSGQQDLLVRNAARLGLPLVKSSLLVLTHGHFDHTGGVPALLNAGARPQIVVHPYAWNKRRVVRDDGTSRDIGIPWPATLLEEAGIHILAADKPSRLLPGIWTTGSIPGLSAEPDPILERWSGGTWAVDSFPDEQAVVVDTVDGLVVITGCCHRGVAATLEAAHAATGTRRVYALVGGLHLRSSGRHAIVKVADVLRAEGVANLWVNHCTGREAYRLLREALGPGVEWAAAGFRRELPLISTQ